MSATTITKRGEDLQRGDVIVDFMQVATEHDPVVVAKGWTCGVITIAHESGETERLMIGYNSTVKVEAPTLTPAQEHAEELLKLVKGMVSGDYTAEDLQSWAIALLGDIDPPKPPTLEETLAALEEVMTKRDNTESAIAILERARRAGVRFGG